MSTQQLKMQQVNGPIPYVAQWKNEPKTYDPRTEGYFAVVNLSGHKIDLGVSERGYQVSLSLSYGDVGTPRATLDQAVAEMAVTIARFPNAQPYLSIVKLPCVFSTRDGWIEIDYSIPMDLLHEAIDAADRDRRFGDDYERFWTTSFERRHGLRI